MILDAIIDELPAMPAPGRRERRVAASQIIALAEQGLNGAEIGRKLGCSRQYVHEVMGNHYRRKLAWQSRLKAAAERRKSANWKRRNALAADFMAHARAHGWSVERQRDAVFVWGYRVRLHHEERDWLHYGHGKRRASGRGYYRLNVAPLGAQRIRAVSTREGWVIATDPGTGSREVRYIDPTLLQASKPWWPTRGELETAFGASELLIFDPSTRLARRHVMRRRYGAAA